MLHCCFIFYYIIVMLYSRIVLCCVLYVIKLLSVFPSLFFTARYYVWPFLLKSICQVNLVLVKGVSLTVLESKPFADSSSGLYRYHIIITIVAA